MTVAIPSFNGRHLLETALPSLAAQSYRDFAVLVVDDASKDGTPAWLRERWPAVRAHALSRQRRRDRGAQPVRARVATASW